MADDNTLLDKPKDDPAANAAAAPGNATTPAVSPSETTFTATGTSGGMPSDKSPNARVQDLFTQLGITPFDAKPVISTEEMQKGWDDRKAQIGEFVRSIKDNKQASLYEQLGNLPHPSAPPLQNIPMMPRSELRSSFEVFRNPLIAAGILGTLFMKRGAINAMAAATGAMEGFNQGEEKRVKLEQQRFKENIQAIKDNNQIALDRYRVDMEDRKLQGQDLLNKIQGSAIELQHSQMIEAAKKGNFQEMYDIYAGQKKLQEGITKAIIDRDAKIRESRFSAANAAKIDQGIKNQLQFYPGMDDSKLGFIAPENQRKLNAAFDSVTSLEDIAGFAKQHPGAVGLLAEISNKWNADALTAARKNPDVADSLVSQVDASIDKFAQGKGPDYLNDAAAAKVLNKKLTTQAFNDAAASGSRGGTIFLDKVFMSLYRQGSSPQAFMGILQSRYQDADRELEKYKLGIANRSDLQGGKFEFWNHGPAAYAQEMQNKKNQSELGRTPERAAPWPGASKAKPNSWYLDKQNRPVFFVPGRDHLLTLEEWKKEFGNGR